MNISDRAYNWSVDHINKKLTVTKWCWHNVYAILTLYIYIYINSVRPGQTEALLRTALIE